ncbi:MAG: PSD1 and planctomycete cytochrome C domain-containing protein [Acidobacteriota bacterium]
MKIRTVALAGLGLLSVSFQALAQAIPDLPPPVQSQVDFERDVEPLLHTKCFLCHGPSQQMNGVRFDQKDAALKGGYSGPIIIPGNSAGSKLIERVASSKDGFRMPPAGPSLSPQEIGVLRAWIDQGANWPARASKPVSQEEREMHWSFQKITRPEVPETRDKAWIRQPIDAFVLAKLESEGIKPSPEADKVTLLRRLSFDLIGLPPTPQEVADFLADGRSDAYERQVDRLLASQHYGERWARPWLDLARYADSDGYEKDQPRRYAWRWRQWVIEALNSDMPFDKFSLEQIAGDLLPSRPAETIVATGFQRNGLKNKEAGVNRKEARFEEMVDRTNTFGTTWLGLTVGCAQCHDHKYDPITQRDYYQLFAFFNSTLDTMVDAPMPGELGPYLQARPGYYQQREKLLAEAQIPVLRTEWEQKIRAARDNPGRNLDWDYAWTEVQAMLDNADRLLRKAPPQRTQREVDLLTNYFVSRPGPEIAKDTKLSEAFKELNNKLRELDNAFPNVSQAAVIVENPEPVKTHVAVRGDYRRAGIEVQPEAPAFLPSLPDNDMPPRVQLAEWLASRDNPLTARVMVNRMWQELFGRGLVVTSEDFGTQGERPSHPELLDWLAAEFMDGGWGMKRLHKLIVMSATYRQSAHARADLKDRDPTNTLLARQNRLRLSAELIRDAALSVSGLLYPAVGGESVRPPQPEGVSKLTYSGAKWEESQGQDRYRRGLYIHYQRTSPYPQLVNFDEPNSNISVSRRVRSNTPLQALNLLNDPVFTEAAQSLALRVLGEAPESQEVRLDRMFQLCFSRRPSPAERQRLAKYFEVQKGILEKEAGSAELVAPNAQPGLSPVETATWVGVARVLMNLDEFITRE